MLIPWRRYVVCGIAGVVSSEAGPREARSDLVRAMCAAIRHRGPDDEGFYLDDHAALGMRRLSIIDLTTGQQPMTGEDGRFWLVFNGEIYNYRELAAELRSCGHTLRTSSDTEVIVHAWEEWGEGALQRLHGMFGFALWDTGTRTLWLARDRPGIKPLHYHASGGRLAFASEIKSLLVDPDAPRELDEEALDHYCSFLYTPPDRSILAGIRKLPPGHVLRWRDGQVNVQRYWDLPEAEDFRGDEREAAGALRAALRSAVRSHMISDVPLGAFLSGGVDSSVIVGLMAEASSRPVRTFSIGFEEAGYNELPYARQVAERFGTEHHEFVVRPDAVAIVDRLVHHFDEPFGDSSAIPTWYVSEIARRHVTVVLSGDGGDELFGGYERYLPHPRVEAFDRWKIPGKQSVAGVAGRHWPRRLRGRAFLRHVALDRESRYLEDVGFFRPDEKAALYSGEFATRLQGRDAFAGMRARFERERHLSWASQMMRFDFHTYLPEDVLTKVDRMSMAHSIESRVPLLDTGVIELAARFPASLRIAGKRQKNVLKESVADLLPASILDRPKHGFGVPVGTWFGGGLRELFADTLLSARARQRGFFRPAAVDALVAEHLEGRRDHTLRLWLLVVLELWQREYVDRLAGARAA
ncbi:MAG: asparagine synthase (glutamine-hydrolyzing) [Acidobacteria bacterium]|nr:MAG: asparagine synthase (glutamine-hydrolyzing) [Acidobacteriota bacterium]